MCNTNTHCSTCKIVWHIKRTNTLTNVLHLRLGTQTACGNDKGNPPVYRWRHKKALTHESTGTMQCILPDVPFHRHMCSRWWNEPKYNCKVISMSLTQHMQSQQLYMYMYMCIYIYIYVHWTFTRMMKSNMHVGGWPHLTSIITPNVTVSAAASRQAFDCNCDAYSGHYGLAYSITLGQD